MTSDFVTVMRDAATLGSFTVRSASAITRVISSFILVRLYLDILFLSAPAKDAEPFRLNIYLFI